ncbi:MAG: SDR family NAD(P)-dependent oxidoreductase [Geminicoccaceae bacterium]
MTTPPLADRIILITGASRGLGRAVAVACAGRGAQVICVARTQGGLEETDDLVKDAGGMPAVLVPMDLRQSPSVETLGAAIAERFGRLDGLVSAAGQLGELSPIAHLQPKVLAASVELLLLVNHRLIRSFDPLLRAASEARAVFVTGSATAADRPFWSAFAASCAGLDALVRAYAAETAKTSLKVNAYDPGPMRTRLRAAAYPGEATERVPMPEEKVAGLLTLLGPDCPCHGQRIISPPA